HPKCPEERGSNENYNKIIRRYVKKGEKMCKFSVKDIQMIQDKINNLPRKILGCRTSKEVSDEWLAQV
ncbi:MAG: IS30 family transposase, partial [Eubacterium aggregans]